MSALELLSILRRRVYYASTQSAETFRLRPQIALDARKFRRSFAVLQLSKCQIGRSITEAGVSSDPLYFLSLT